MELKENHVAICLPVDQTQGASVTQAAPADRLLAGLSHGPGSAVTDEVLPGGSCCP